MHAFFPVERPGLHFSHVGFSGFCGSGSDRSPSQLSCDVHVILNVDFRLDADRALIGLGIDQRERYFSHAGGLAVTRAGKDHVFHAHAAQTFGRLLAQHPGNRVRNIGFSAPVGAHHGGNAFARKLQFRAITEGLESKDLQLLEF